MGQVLYRKYRSKDLSEVIGQEHITTPLLHALKSGKIAHAYLFSGPRGVGKTSVARILAYAVNGLPYDDSNHLDIIEIDAASNRRIDEIRDLRDKVNIVPTSAKYKVYIIDEVHMLTREAFNALLKTLEEPPEHVIFILATTEAHKLPDTIISRTQRYSFKPVSREKVIEHLRTIAKKEKIKIDDEALGLIADHGEGSFRDSISLLDQLSHQDNTITLGDVQIALGIAPLEAVNNLIDAVAKSDLGLLNISLSQLYEQGYQATILAKQLAGRLREDLVKETEALPRQLTLTILKELLEVPVSANPDSLLEIILLDAAFLGMVEVEAKAISETPESNPEPSEVIEAPEPKENAKPQKKDLAPGKKEFNEALWPEVLAILKTKHNTLYSFLRMARPEFTDTTLELHFAFKFHQQRINESKNKQVILDTIYELSGKDIELTCSFVPGTKPYEIAPDSSVAIDEIDSAKDPTLDTINNIFGGGEVLES